jgi:hypothetical protein
MDRQEAWEGAQEALRSWFCSQQFGEGEFEIHHNDGVGTISIIHRPTRSVLELTDTTGSHYDSENRIVFPDDPSLMDRLHGHRKVRS